MQNNSKCSHTSCVLRFFAALRLAMNPDLYFEIGYNKYTGHQRLSNKLKY